MTATPTIHLFTCKQKWDAGLHPVTMLVWDEGHDVVRLHAPQGSVDEGRAPSVTPGTPLIELLEHVYHSANGLQLAPASLLPGEYHRRVWRNGISHDRLRPGSIPPAHPADLPALRQRAVAFHRIQRQLADLFAVVTPVKKHRAVHGEAIAQVLTLAASEVERHLHEVFIANASKRFLANLGRPKKSVARGTMKKWKRKVPSITEFHSLESPMRLGEWRSSLVYYQEWGEIRPFDGWRAHAPPSWWNANNKLKHEPRHGTRANLEAAIGAVVAVRILLEAQFGPAVEELLPSGGLASVEITKRPTWSADELYFPPTKRHPGGAFRARPLFR